MTALPPDDDIVAQLRVMADPGRLNYSRGWFAKAADEIVRLRAELSALRAEREDLWEYVWAMEATNIAMDAGTRPDVARVNAAQERLKQRHASKAGEESAAIPASDSTVPPGDGAAACKG